MVAVEHEKKVSNAAYYSHSYQSTEQKLLSTTYNSSLQLILLKSNRCTISITTTKLHTTRKENHSTRCEEKKR